jgi:hypothetical protein
VRAPQDDAGNPRKQELRNGEITDTTPVAAALVGDHQDVAGGCAVERLEKHVDTTVVTTREGRPDHRLSGQKSPDPDRRSTEAFL